MTRPVSAERADAIANSLPVPSDRARRILRRGGCLVRGSTYGELAALAPLLETSGLGVDVRPAWVGRLRRGAPWGVLALAALIVAIVNVPLGFGERPLRDVVREVRVSTVRIERPGATGSGFVAAAGYVVTNEHVVGESTSVEVQFSDGRSVEGAVVRKDEALDLALVSVDTAATAPLALLDVTEVEAGDPIVVAGNPFGLESSVSSGRVRSVGRGFMKNAYVEVDASVNPGNSGGPLLDRDGRVLGVVSLKMTRASRRGLALPINYVYEFAPDYLVPSVTIDDARWRAMKEDAQLVEVDLGEASSHDRE